MRDGESALIQAYLFINKSLSYEWLLKNHQPIDSI